MQKGIGAIAVVLIGLLGIGGCGGDSSVSKAEYEQQVELVCKKGLEERQDLLKRISQEYLRKKRNASAKEQADLQAENLRQLMGIYREVTEEIADAGLPTKGEAMAEELVAERESGIAKIEADPKGTIGEFGALFAKANKIAEDLDVPSCAK